MIRANVLIIPMALIVSASVSLADAPDPGQLVSVSAWDNGGFEAGLAGWEFHKGWNPMGPDLKDKAIHLRRGDAVQGETYLRIENPAGDRFFALTRDVKWRPNVAYTLSWWMRGSAAKVDNERGNIRLRVSNYGGPEYPGQFPYVVKDWTYVQLPLYSSSSSSGSVQLWVWPEGACELDAVTLRPAFWQPQSAWALPGQPFALELAVPERTSAGSAETAYELTAPDGTILEQGTRRGALPLRHELKLVPTFPGYYRLESRTRLSGGAAGRGAMVDRVGVPVLSPEEGIEAVRKQWDAPETD